jgi:hypothetical protein
MSAGIVVDLGDQRFARNVAKVHSHGPDFLARLLATWGGDRLLRTELEQLFKRAAELDPAAVTAAGADRWLPT